MDNRKNILIVDDEPRFRELLRSRLQRRNYNIIEAEDGVRALEHAEGARVDLALVDINLPKMDGIELLQRLKELDERIEVVIVTGYSNIETAIAAMKHGAYDYLSKPYKLSELEAVVERALEKQRLTLCCAGLSAEVNHLRERSWSLPVGQSEPWLNLMQVVQKIASLGVPVSVLITGPSGAGKEVIARALHQLSNANCNPFVPINCSLLQENLLDSELFGHKKGSFTGAVADKEGLFYTARDGILFLDEIGELPESSQAKLLRVLETGEYRPVGGTKELHTNARIIAATNVDLEKAVAEGRFRQDLFYRLNVINIKVPSLSERRDDVPLLVEHFMERGKSLSAVSLKFTSEAMVRLMAYPWPGNTRELRNVVERIMVLNVGDKVEDAMVAAMLNQQQEPAVVTNSAPFDRVIPLEELEYAYVKWAADQLDGNLSALSRRLGISRSKVYRILKQIEASV